MDKTISTTNSENTILFLEELEKTVLVKPESCNVDWKRYVYGFECANWTKC